MVRYQFEIATRADDAELRSILAATPMDGVISLSFRREPSFFDAAIVEGDFYQVVVCRDKVTGRIAGFGCRSVREMYIDGHPRQMGYLSALRALPAYRSQGLVARGYAFLRELHADGRTPSYLTTVAKGNNRSLPILTSGRAGMPSYRFSGNYHTMVLPITRRRRLSSQIDTSVRVREATHDDLQDVIKFLQVVGPTRQFFPCYRQRDFFGKDASLRDLVPSDLLLAFCGRQLVGTLGGWDQRAFKQSVVERYASPLRWSRPIYNTWARLRGLPGLPPLGTAFRCLTGAVPLVLNDKPNVFLALLETLLEKIAHRPCDYLLIGMHESDPLLPLLQPYQTGCYLTQTYLVCWDDDENSLPEFGKRPVYMELGCL